MTEILRVRGLRKRFRGVTALEAVPVKVATKENVTQFTNGS
jgi:ABC-type branched-subunit amino acid transport system ATPase component